jgi:hypothetical protein
MKYADLTVLSDMNKTEAMACHYNGSGKKKEN